MTTDTYMRIVGAVILFAALAVVFIFGKPKK